MEGIHREHVSGEFVGCTYKKRVNSSHEWLTDFTDNFSEHVPFPSKIEQDLANGHLSKLLKLLIRYSGLGVRSVGPVGDFLDHFLPRDGQVKSFVLAFHHWPNTGKESKR